jgi:hypothetical protein
MGKEPRPAFGRARAAVRPKDLIRPATAFMLSSLSFSADVKVYYFYTDVFFINILL